MRNVDRNHAGEVSDNYAYREGWRLRGIPETPDTEMSTFQAAKIAGRIFLITLMVLYLLLWLAVGAISLDAFAKGGMPGIERRLIELHSAPIRLVPRSSGESHWTVVVPAAPRWPAVRRYLLVQAAITVGLLLLNWRFCNVHRGGGADPSRAGLNFISGRDTRRRKGGKRTA